MINILVCREEVLVLSCKKIVVCKLKIKKRRIIILQLHHRGIPPIPPGGIPSMPSGSVILSRGYHVVNAQDHLSSLGCRLNSLFFNL